MFECAGGGSGQLFVGVTSDAQWRRFAAEFGMEALGGDPRLETNAMRVPEKEWLVPAVGAVLAEAGFGVGEIDELGPRGVVVIRD